MTAPVSTPWSTVAPLITGKPSWIPPLDLERVQSYDQYDDIYWNDNGNLRILMRGTDDLIIYVPEARTIVEATQRYVGNGFNFQVDPNTGTPASQEAATLAFTNLFRREAFISQYNDNKRFGLVRGDWCWHITADPNKEQGKRLKIMPVHPGNYFPIFESDVVDGGSPDKIVKVHIAERVVGSDGKPFVRRQTYERDPNNGQIISSCFTFDEEKWFLEGGSPTGTIQPPTYLDPLITTFPIYHIRNRTEPLNPWGSSELRGLERMLAALAQSMSDEDMALALEGLGVYYTESGGQFRDADGTLVDPQLYPGVILRGTKLNRVQGIGSVQPYGDHIERMVRFLRESSGTPDVAVGKVDAQVAESGIALALQLGPMLAKAAEADQRIIDVHTQMFYDLVQGWFPAYEQMRFIDAVVLPVLGSKIPPNVAAMVTMVSGLVVAGLMSKKTGRENLAAAGIKFAPDEDARIAAEAEASALDANLGGDPDNPEDQQFEEEAAAGE